MWKVVTSSNLNPLLKLFFYSPILTNNNLLFKIYCENIIVTFLNYDFLFFILFLFSIFSLQPYAFVFVFCFFSYAISSTTHTLSLSSTPSLSFYPHTFQHSHSPFIFSSSLSLVFFLLLPPYTFFLISLSPPSFLSFSPLLMKRCSWAHLMGLGFTPPQL